MSNEKITQLKDVNRAIMEQEIDNGIKSSISNGNSKRRSVLVLINPHSGLGKSVSIYKSKLLPILKSHNIDDHVFITASDSRVHDYLRTKSISEILNFISIIVVSGDGLFHEAINALMSRADWKQAISVPIGIVPTGSGNGLAYTLIRQNHPDLKSRDEAIKICCEQAIQDKTCLIDLVKITFGRSSTIWSFLSFGWGLLADIDIDSEWLRRLGEFRFTVYGLLRSITSVSYRCRLSFKVATLNLENETESDNGRKINLESNTTFKMFDTSHDTADNENHDDWIHIEDNFTCLYAVYQSYISSITKFAPKSTLTDQLIYLTYIRGKLSPCRAVEFLLAAEDGSHDKLPYVTVVPVTNFKFQPLEFSKIVVDGEVIPWNISNGPITAEIVPKIIKLSWDHNTHHSLS